MNSKISIMSRITSTTAPKNVDPPCHMMISSVDDDECKPEDACLLYDRGIALAEFGSDFHIYLLVLKCTAQMGADDRAGMARPATRWMSLFFLPTRMPCRPTLPRCRQHSHPNEATRHSPISITVRHATSGTRGTAPMSCAAWCITFDACSGRAQFPMRWHDCLPVQGASAAGYL